MANNGGGISVPTALRPTPSSFVGTAAPPSSLPLLRPGRAVSLAAAVAAPPPTVATTSPPPSGGPPPPPPPFTLALPRPENERAANEYVETPFRPPPPPAVAHAAAALFSHQQQQQQPPPPPAPRPTRLAVTKQPPPAASSFSKDPPAQAECATRPSIVCPDCGRCRCDSCQQPKPLPQRWVCNNSYLISADSVIDYASCLCCVKGLFYHCSEADGEQADCADAPCGCGPDKRAARWSCLAALSCVLPCLWLYWPLRGCKRVVEACYARHSRTGCRCRPPLPTPEKRLLDSSGDF